jgi:hypothetical protein
LRFTAGALPFEEPAMSPSAKEFEEFAKECVRLAGQADAPELRDKLLNIAREWMRAAIVKESGEEREQLTSAGRRRGRKKSQPVGQGQ